MWTIQVRDFQSRWFKSGSFLGVMLVGLACATSPTGRKQLILVPDGQMTQLGADSFAEIKKDTPIEKDESINRYVRCVADPIAATGKSKAKVSKWEIVVFKSDEANAFALPGGKIGVYTGLLKVADTEDQLAAVLGHEVGHVIARHGAERVSEGLVAQAGLSAIAVVTKENPNQAKLMGLLGVGTQFGVVLPHSRTHETEADTIGLDLMAKSGFNPEQSIQLWKNMSKAGGSPPEFMSTHPSHESRIENLQSHMTAAKKVYEKARTAGKAPACTATGPSEKRVTRPKH